MIIMLENLKSVKELSQIDDMQLLSMLEAIEDFIRQYTNNSFVNKNITFNAPSKNGKLDAVLPPFKVGDTVLISKSIYNDGVYVIEDTNGTLNRSLFDSDNNKVTLIQYPQSIKSGVIKLLQYDTKMTDKMGISSESISRHSVTYSQLSDDAINGYPPYLMSFLEPYMKARF